MDNVAVGRIWETAESEMRNARGRMNRGEAQARAEKSRSKPAREKKPAQFNKENRQRDAHGLMPERNERRPENVQNQVREQPGSARPENAAPRHKHRRNRPGSRARRRMRENGGAV